MEHEDFTKIAREELEKAGVTDYNLRVNCMPWNLKDLQEEHVNDVVCTIEITLHDTHEKVVDLVGLRQHNPKAIREHIRWKLELIKHLIK